MKTLTELSYANLKNWVLECGYSLQDLPLTAQTTDGEDVVLDWAEAFDDKAFCVSILQSNNWWRKEVFHEDGTHEELYFR